MANFACGIDFGTTNSTIGVLSAGRPVMIDVENGKKSIPTALFFEENNDSPILGREAIEKYIDGQSGRFIRSIKRILGTDLMDKFTIINRKPVRFDDLIGIFLSALKRKAENEVKQKLNLAVIGRPVHFQDNDEKADILAEEKLRKIGKNIGFDDVFFQYEPIAAAFSHEQNLTSEKLALIIDLGGGTSDFTLIRIGPKLMSKKNRKDDVLSTSGVRIGGNDFDKSLNLFSVMPSFGKGTTYGDKKLSCPAYLFSDLSEWSKINFTYTQQNIELVKRILNVSNAPDKIERLLGLLQFEEAHRLLNVVEMSKIDLSSTDCVCPVFDSFMEKIPFVIGRKDLDESIKDDVDKIQKSMNECLAKGGIKSSEVDLLILTGGSCQIPYVRGVFQASFPNAEVIENEKMLSVGIGLTYATKFC